MGAPQSQPDTKVSEPRSKPRLDIPNYMYAIAALITAVGGFFGGRATNGSSATPEPTVTVTRTVIEAPSGQGEPPTSGGTAQASSDTTLNDPVQWHGSFKILTSGYNLDTDPPQSDSISPSVLTTFDPYGKIELTTSNTGAMIALWTGSGAPSEQDCNDAAKSTNAGTVKVSVGATYCVVTLRGRTVALVVTGIQSVVPMSVSGTARVWGVPG